MLADTDVIGVVGVVDVSCVIGVSEVVDLLV